MPVNGHARTQPVGLRLRVDLDESHFEGLVHKEHINGFFKPFASNLEKNYTIRMARKKSLAETETARVTLTTQMAAVLDHLASTGLVGANRSAVIQYLVTAGIQQMQMDGRLPKSVSPGQTIADVISKK